MIQWHPLWCQVQVHTPRNSITSRLQVSAMTIHCSYNFKWAFWELVKPELGFQSLVWPKSCFHIIDSKSLWHRVYCSPPAGGYHNVLALTGIHLYKQPIMLSIANLKLAPHALQGIIVNQYRGGESKYNDDEWCQQNLLLHQHFRRFCEDKMTNMKHTWKTCCSWFCSVC